MNDTLDFLATAVIDKSKLQSASRKRHTFKLIFSLFLLVIIYILLSVTVVALIYGCAYAASHLGA
ncbi:MAG: hypothetical protein ACTHLE_11905 [Agriterribacter sp.]